MCRWFPIARLICASDANSQTIPYVSQYQFGGLAPLANRMGRPTLYLISHAGEDTRAAVNHWRTTECVFDRARS